MVDWNKYSFLLALFSIVASAVIGVASGIFKRHSATSDQVDEVHKRVAVLETQLETLPDSEAIGTFREGMAAKLGRIEAYQKANHNRLSRIEDYLLNKER